ncbi:MAG: hypothetical protein LLG42_04320 [Chloroflexi bacterium]|nr:hypothetical protein [Chloroflexota bacterium]
MKKYDFSIDTNVKTLMTTPESADVIERYMPGIKKNPAVKMAYSMTFRAAAAFPAAGITPENLIKIDEELKAL